MTEIPLQELRENFDYFDKDGSGKLSKAEFIGLMEALGFGGFGEEMALGFKAIDTDGSGMIEFDEFAAWFHAR